jgi:hypothetical protein
MSDNFDIGQLVDDFVVGNRRVGDQPDLKAKIHAGIRSGIVDDKPPRPTSPVPKVTAPQFDVYRGINPVELTMERLLIHVVGYVTNATQARNERQLGFMLQLIREGLGLTPMQIALEIGVPSSSIRRWETGDFTAGVPIYWWCSALGLVRPPNFAHVEVIDISPALIQALKDNPNELRRLTPEQFEKFVANRLDRMGYNVNLTGPTTRTDGGIDIIAVPKVMNVASYVLAAQVKHHRGEQKTGRDAVDRLLAWKDTNITIALLVTNTAFTKPALWTAALERNKHFLRLRDFTDLKRWLQDQYGSPEDWREIPDQIEVARGIVIKVPKQTIYLPSGELVGDYIIRHER